MREWYKNFKDLRGHRQRETQSTYPLSASVKMEMLPLEINISQEAWWKRQKSSNPQNACICGLVSNNWANTATPITELSSALWIKFKTLILKFKDLINKYSSETDRSQRVTRKPRWTLGYTCLFPFWFPQCVCPAVGLLDHKAVTYTQWSITQPLKRIHLNQL